MSGRKLLDTNILIYLSRKEISLTSFASPTDELFISVITYMEALGYSFRSGNEEKIITGLCKNLTVIHLDEMIVDEVIRIRRKNKIKLPDAIIAATTVKYKLDLITHNTADFKAILPKRNIIDPLVR
ncbi:MAG: type II toxin-antitoxin system VapC family toxin [Chlorobi bacterium]|nr:type II toxin-antitoxin system VapC family toxin [Chlorobiota bacterium]